MRHHRKNPWRRRTTYRAHLALALAGALIVTLGACTRPQPNQDAVLDEGYLAFPDATKIDEDFHQGNRGGLGNVDGGPPSPNPSYLSIHYQLDRPTAPQDIVSWYDDKLQIEGWAVESPDAPSSTKLRKQVGDVTHVIEVRPAVQSTDTKYTKYEIPAEGQAATHYSVGYTLYFR